MRNLIIIVIIIVVALVIVRQALYVVDVTEQVIILRFGEVVNTQNTPGLNVKLPFVDTVVRLDKRILRIDAPATSMPDQDKENLVIDIYARYRIIDAVQFRKTLQTENNARSRLGDIVISTLRDRVALRDRTDIIGAKTQLDEFGIPVVDTEGIPLVEAQETRTDILVEVLLRVQEITQRIISALKSSTCVSSVPTSHRPLPIPSTPECAPNVTVSLPDSAPKVKKKTARFGPTPTATATSSWLKLSGNPTSGVVKVKRRPSRFWRNR